MFLWKSLDAGVASRALTVLLRRPAAAQSPGPAPEAPLANRNAKPAETVRST